MHTAEKIQEFKNSLPVLDTFDEREEDYKLVDSEIDMVTDKAAHFEKYTWAPKSLLKIHPDGTIWIVEWKTL